MSTLKGMDIKMKKIINFMLVGCLIITMAMPMSVVASSSTRTTIEKKEDRCNSKNVEKVISVSLSQLDDGITILITKSKDGKYTYLPIEEQNNIDDSYFNLMGPVEPDIGGADGNLEWAAFHLGFVYWNNNRDRLYYTITADEPLRMIKGNAYVQSPSFFFPKVYYEGSFRHNLGGSQMTSRTLKESVKTDGEEKVRIGFSDVKIETISGEKGFFSDTSQTVKMK